MNSVTIDQQLLSDFSYFSTIDPSQIAALINLVLGFLCDSRGDFQTELGEYAEMHHVDTKVLKVLVRGLLIFLQGAIREGWSTDQLESRCTPLGLTKEITGIIVAEWQRRYSQLVSSLLARTVTANKLVDMDWSFGVTASSNDSDQIGKTFLQLKLTIDHGEGKGNIAHYMELDLEQFYQFLSSMENCSKYITHLEV